MTIESVEFTTIKEFNKAYKQIRNDILQALGITGKARINSGVIVLYKEINGSFCKYTTYKDVMIDNINLSAGKSKFKLVANNFMVTKQI